MLAHPSTIDNLKSEITSHPGMKALEEFGANLASRPLRRDELRVFLATTAAFFREVPAGILALGLRVTDDWMPRDRFGAVSRGASVLYAAVDEFGLHAMDKGLLRSHHGLFLDMAQDWGVSEAELTNPRYVLGEGEELAALTAELYRRRPIPEALGFHVASEITSEREFTLCYQGFRAFPAAYGLSGPDDPGLMFYFIHTVVEPMHGATGMDSIRMYAEQDPAVFEAGMRGALAFMDGYGRLFEAFNGAFYSQG
jgi:hypothetical protein